MGGARRKLRSSSVPRVAVLAMSAAAIQAGSSISLLVLAAMQRFDLVARFSLYAALVAMLTPLVTRRADQLIGAASEMDRQPAIAAAIHNVKVALAAAVGIASLAILLSVRTDLGTGNLLLVCVLPFSIISGALTSCESYRRLREEGGHRAVVRFRLSQALLLLVVWITPTLGNTDISALLVFDSGVRVACACAFLGLGREIPQVARSLGGSAVIAPRLHMNRAASVVASTLAGNVLTVALVLTHDEAEIAPVLIALRLTVLPGSTVSTALVQSGLARHIPLRGFYSSVSQLHASTPWLGQSIVIAVVLAAGGPDEKQVEIIYWSAILLPWPYLLVASARAQIRVIQTAAFGFEAGFHIFQAVLRGLAVVISLAVADLELAMILLVASTCSAWVVYVRKATGLRVDYIGAAATFALTVIIVALMPRVLSPVGLGLAVHLSLWRLKIDSRDSLREAEVDGNRRRSAPCHFAPSARSSGNGGMFRRNHAWPGWYYGKG